MCAEPVEASTFQQDDNDVPWCETRTFVLSTAVTIIIVVKHFHNKDIPMVMFLASLKIAEYFPIISNVENGKTLAGKSKRKKDMKRERERDPSSTFL